jgi:Arm DNA-binding domain
LIFLAIPFDSCPFRIAVASQWFSAIEPRCGNGVALGTFRFTQTRVEALVFPSGKASVYFHDADVRGLVLFVSATGAKTFYLYNRIDGRPARVRLGAWPHELSIDEARTEATKKAGDLAKGHNPHKDRLLNYSSTRAERGQAAMAHGCSSGP